MLYSFGYLAMVRMMVDSGSATYWTTAVPYTTYSLESVVRGHHVYKEIWNSFIGEELSCQREDGNIHVMYAVEGNIHDMYAVSVIKELCGREAVVGHLPRQISTVCHLFLRKGVIIACHVTNSRQYSADLPQGGLEVPCN